MFVSCSTSELEVRFTKTNLGTSSVESFARVVCLLQLCLVLFYFFGVPSTCVAWWSSVSLSGGNQVEGLPPAPSTGAGAICRIGGQ